MFLTYQVNNNMIIVLQKCLDNVSENKVDNSTVIFHSNCNTNLSKMQLFINVLF